MFYSGPEWQSWVLTCWLSSSRTWFIEPSHSAGSPLTSVSLRCSQTQETTSGFAETSSGIVAISSSSTWICVGWAELNSGGSDTENAHTSIQVRYVGTRTKIHTKQTDTQEWWEPTRGERKTHRTCSARNHKETVMRVKPIETWHPTNNFRSNQLHILRQQGSKAEWEGEGQALKPRMTVLLSNGRSAQTHSDIPSCSNTAPSFEAEAGCCLWNGIKGKHGHAAKQMHN